MGVKSEAKDIIEDMKQVGVLNINEIREMLILGETNKKTNKKIEAILSIISTDEEYLKLLNNK